MTDRVVRLPRSVLYLSVFSKSKSGKPLPRAQVAPIFAGHEGHDVRVATTAWCVCVWRVSHTNVQPYCVSCVTEWVRVKVSEMNPVVPCLHPNCKIELNVKDLHVCAQRHKHRHRYTDRHIHTLTHADTHKHTDRDTHAHATDLAIVAGGC